MSDPLTTVERATDALLARCATTMRQLAVTEATLRQKTFLTSEHKTRTSRRRNAQHLKPNT